MPNMNDYIDKMYEYCDEWRFKFISDQWWLLRATCEHTVFKVTSNTAMPDEAFKRLLGEVMDYHQK